MHTLRRRRDELVSEGPPPSIEEPAAVRVNTLFATAGDHTRAANVVRAAGERLQRSYDAYSRDSIVFSQALRAYAQIIRAQQSSVVQVSGSQPRTASGVRDRLATMAGVFDEDDAFLKVGSEAEERTSSMEVGAVTDVVLANDSIASSLEHASRGQTELVEALSKVQAVINDFFVSQLGTFVRTEANAQKDSKKTFQRACSRLDTANYALHAQQHAKRANTKKLRDVQEEHSITQNAFFETTEICGRALEVANKSAEVLIFTSTRAFMEEMNSMYSTGSAKTSSMLAVMEDYKEAAKLLTKQRDARRDRFARTQRHTLRVMTVNVFGAHIRDIVAREKRPQPIPILVEVLCDWLLEHAGNTEGVFRINASINLLNDVKGRMSQCKDKASTSELIEGLAAKTNGIDGHVHLCAHLLKMFFRDLAEPLLSHTLYEQFIASAFAENSVDEIVNVVLQLPEANALTLAYLVKVCDHLVQNTAVTKMTAANLATVLSPNLLSPIEQATNPQDMIREMEGGSRVLQCLISNIDNPSIQRSLRMIQPADSTGSEDKIEEKAEGDSTTEAEGYSTPEADESPSVTQTAPALPPRTPKTEERLKRLSQKMLPVLPPKKLEPTDAPAARERKDASLILDSDCLVDVTEALHAMGKQLFRLVQELFETDDGGVGTATDLLQSGFAVVAAAPRVRDLALAVKDIADPANALGVPGLSAAARNMKVAITETIRHLQAAAAAQESGSSDEKDILESFMKAVTNLVAVIAELSVETTNVRRKFAIEEVQKSIQFVARRLAAVLRGVSDPSDAAEAEELLAEFQHLTEYELNDRIEEALFYILPSCTMHQAVLEASHDVQLQSMAFIRHVRQQVAAGLPTNDLRVDLAKNSKGLVLSFRSLSEKFRESRTTSGAFSGDPAKLIGAAVEELDGAAKAANPTVRPTLVSLSDTLSGNAELKFRTVGELSQLYMTAIDIALDAADESVASVRLCDASTGWIDQLRFRACQELSGVPVEEFRNGVEVSKLAPPELLLFGLAKLLKRATRF